VFKFYNFSICYILSKDFLLKQQRGYEQNSTFSIKIEMIKYTAPKILKSVVTFPKMLSAQEFSGLPSATLREK